ncbi:RNA-binding protein [Methanoplanus endosymbiosus]|uniref:RNA-binding protein n=1 Tax=Methanoplanus endosymbiosus TaxID=33865 RepID=A0A9E7PK14_9EURY|nr:RNA-binding protein [Methanoplanus endosymbiosus]UUX91430.1 RNA-binding protein [Methanoplanus endosymbiosus]
MAKIGVKKRYSLRKSKVSDIFKKLEEQIGESSAIFKKDRIEVVETTADFELYLTDRNPWLMELNGWVFPTLRGIVKNSFPERKVVVDSGAVPYMVNGADLMRPGVISVSHDIKKGMPFVIYEVTHGKPLAIAEALMDAAEMEAADKGKVGKNVHYVGDDLWNLEF